MFWGEILLIAFGVSIDAAAVSAAGSACPGTFTRKHCAWNAALFFGGAQFIMPVAGFFAAGTVRGKLAAVDHYAALLLLCFVGGKMIWESWCSRNACENARCPLGGDFFAARNMFVPAVATSLDALAVGAGIAFAGNSIWIPAAAMGIVTGICSALSVYAGKFVMKKCGSWYFGIAGGIAIIAVGVKIFLEDILS
ncbi:MAG: manganese efflux pump [Lentisphaeria bacterium]|nr:manganese efflux pump [Lentisphaeria bacterium]